MLSRANRALLESRIRVALHMARCALARRRWFLEFDGCTWHIIKD
jgi:hypothetical protein